MVVAWIELVHNHSKKEIFNTSIFIIFSMIIYKLELEELQNTQQSNII